MYDYRLHPYNGLSEEPNPEDVADSVLGAIIGYAIGTTICYSYQDKPPQAVVSCKTYVGNGPEGKAPGELDKNTWMAMELIHQLLDSKTFGEDAMAILRPGYFGSPTDLMEDSYRTMLLNQPPNRDSVLGLVLGPAVLFQPTRALTIARMVQNHPVTDAVVLDYLYTMKVAITQRTLCDGDSYYGGPVRRLVKADGRITTTFNNSIMWVKGGLPFIRTMELICSRGGPTTIVGGVTGALWGALQGVKELPPELVNELRSLDTLKELGVDAARQITGC